MRGSTLNKILSPQFMTGGPTSDVKPDPKKPGVQQYTSAFAKADQRDALNVAKMTRKCTVVISPFMMEDPASGAKMMRYAARCAQDSTNRGEAPLMAHAFYYSVLNYMNSIERDMGLHSQLSWIPRAELVVVYVDFGITAAMQVAINVAEVKNRKIEYRSIGATA